MRVVAIGFAMLSGFAAANTTDNSGFRRLDEEEARAHRKVFDRAVYEGDCARAIEIGNLMGASGHETAKMVYQMAVCHAQAGRPGRSLELVEHLAAMYPEEYVDYRPLLDVLALDEYQHALSLIENGSDNDLRAFLGQNPTSSYASMIEDELIEREVQRLVARGDPFEIEAEIAKHPQTTKAALLQRNLTAVRHAAFANSVTVELDGFAYETDGWYEPERTTYEINTSYPGYEVEETVSGGFYREWVESYHGSLVLSNQSASQLTVEVVLTWHQRLKHTVKVQVAPGELERRNWTRRIERNEPDRIQERPSLSANLTETVDPPEIRVGRER